MRIPKSFLVLILVMLAACGSAAGESKDPLAARIERCAAQECKPAADALRDGRRLLALQRLAAVWTDVVSQEYLSERTAAQRNDQAAFEAEWARMGQVLRDGLGTPSPTAFEGVRPALVRAVGETSLPPLKIYYDASLEYGRNTQPQSGLYYLGAAQAQRELGAFVRTLSEPATGHEPPVRALGAELDALEAELLAVYRPPASIDNHPDFIALSSTVKEARELDAAGLRYGALLRYLQAARHLALLAGKPSLDADTLTRKLREYEERLSAGDVDHSIGRMFLEAAQASLAQTAPGARPVSAEVALGDVLPRYFAALGPAPPAPPQVKPQVTVTLVRWPYT
ncbi:MAG TPA: hypothetical protein VMW27_14135 [Thermoanaerobaculia bacterium]|nr:hypothetical protein [Thermoanaerobaculia bacterium]